MVLRHPGGSGSVSRKSAMCRGVDLSEHRNCVFWVPGFRALTSVGSCKPGPSGMQQQVQGSAAAAQGSAEAGAMLQPSRRAQSFSLSHTVTVNSLAVYWLSYWDFCLFPTLAHLCVAPNEGTWWGPESLFLSADLMAVRSIFKREIICMILE